MNEQEHEVVQELAYIRRVAYGYNGDRGVGAALELQLLRNVVTIFVGDTEVSKILRNQKIPDITMLGGRPCVVVISGDVVGFSHLL